jgi:hypothetical protein
MNLQASRALLLTYPHARGSRASLQVSPGAVGAPDQAVSVQPATPAPPTPCPLGPGSLTLAQLFRLQYC